MTKLNKSYLKLGDRVKIITGDQKGFIGVILSILNKKKECFVLIDGILPRIKYTKSTQKDGNPEKKELPVAIHISNVMLWDSEKSTISRINYQLNEGKKVRVFKKSGTFVK